MIPTEKYWQHIEAFCENHKVEGIDVFAVYIYLNNGQMTWLSNCLEAAKDYAEAGFTRADLVHSAEFRDENRVIYTNEYDDNDDIQRNLTGLMHKHNFYRIYGLSRQCHDCSLLLFANQTDQPPENPAKIYKETVADFELFCNEFVTELLDAYIEALPALTQTRFTTDPDYRLRVIQQRNNATDNHTPELTERDKEILYWASPGKTAEETGLILKFSKQTVDTYRKQIITKMEAQNLLHAVTLAKKLNLIN